ncbi:hypothetical protein [Natronobacterium texcoconense]|uniref:Uncharacterized protein n=1 Tax=Natronobacterium texcoconense TaxID=1095778 RepID=A0A1H1IPY0_NATTX|nr:hypothetical protein [Natronobacterium texcoconense]SDR39775.1 hypothetical protein SAMN04489842_3709 [Natronobacterium texcoconense]
MVFTSLVLSLSLIVLGLLTAVWLWRGETRVRYVWPVFFAVYFVDIAFLALVDAAGPSSLQQEMTYRLGPDLVLPGVLGVVALVYVYRLDVEYGVSETEESEADNPVLPSWMTR